MFGFQTFLYGIGTCNGMFTSWHDVQTQKFTHPQCCHGIKLSKKSRKGESNCSSVHPGLKHRRNESIRRDKRNKEEECPIDLICILPENQAYKGLVYHLLSAADLSQCISETKRKFT